MGGNKMKNTTPSKHHKYCMTSLIFSYCCLTPTQQYFSATRVYRGKSKLIFNEIMMKSTSYKTNMLSWILIVLASSLKQQSTDRHVASLGHIFQIPRIPALSP